MHVVYYNQCQNPDVTSLFSMPFPALTVPKCFTEITDFLLHHTLHPSSALFLVTYRHRLAWLRSTVQGLLAWPGTEWHWILSAGNRGCIQTGPQSRPRTQNRAACRTEAQVPSCTGCRWCEEQLQHKHEHN